MMDGSFSSYSEIAGNHPKEAEIAGLLRPLDARKVLFLLCRIKMHLRLATDSEGTTYKRAVGNLSRRSRYSERRRRTSECTFIRYNC